MTDRESEFHALYRDLRIVDQKRFYEARREEYRAAHRQAIVARNVLLVASALVGVAGQLTSGTARAGLAVVSAVLASLAAAVTAFESLIGFLQLSKLYSDAALNLAEAELDWEAADPNGDLARDLDRVEEIFRKENGQWGQLIVEAASASGPDVETTHGGFLDEDRPIGENP